MKERSSHALSSTARASLRLLLLSVIPFFMLCIGYVPAARAFGTVCVFNASGADAKTTGELRRQLAGYFTSEGYTTNARKPWPVLTEISNDVYRAVANLMSAGFTSFQSVDAYVARASIRAQGQDTTWDHLAVMQHQCKTYPAGTNVQYWTQHWWSGYDTINGCHDWVMIQDGTWVNVILTGSMRSASCDIDSSTPKSR